MQDWDALKYFLINLGLHNLVLVLVAAGLGLVLGRLLWARSAQGLVQLREKVAAEGERAKEAERELEKFAELRERLDSGEDGPVVVNSPELEAELAALRERSLEADATLEQMMVANQALEAVVKELEQEKAAWEEGGTTGREHDEAEVAALRAEIEVLRREAGSAEEERTALQADLKAAEEKLEAVPDEKAAEVELQEQVEALQAELEEAKSERQQVEEASAILRKELYGMRHQLEEVEKREVLEKELDLALHDAEQRLSRLQAEVAAANRGGEVEAGKADGDARSATDEEKDEVVKLTVAEDGDQKEVEEEASPDSEAAEQDDLTRIRGIGAVLAKRLNEAGVVSFRQIAGWSKSEVKEVSERLSLKKRVKNGDWQAQARAMLEEDGNKDS
jgi:predicted flap endonuclease-1-like 5' DNA nuclease